LETVATNQGEERAPSAPAFHVRIFEDNHEIPWGLGRLAPTRNGALIMVPPGAFSKQLESGHEFTRKRLVEMEGGIIR
jgi:hypothetical protein